MHLRPCLLLLAAALHAQSPLKLIQVISLPEVHGRIDHMTVNAPRRHVVLSALGSDALVAVDTFAGRVRRTITPIPLPEGALWAPGVDKLYTASAGNGKVYIYDAATYQLRAAIDFGSEADNLRFDAAANRIWVGYGDGAIGALDARTDQRLNISYPLGEHPEGFQMETKGPRIFVNLPGTRRVAVINRSTGAITHWPLANAGMNFPMALDESGARLYIGCRRPSVIKVLDTATGRELATLPAAADMDDLLFDPARKRLYAAGGEGVITVLQQTAPARWTASATIPTRTGARTAWFDAQRDRLYLAVPSLGGQTAALWVYAPQD